MNKDWFSTADLIEAVEREADYRPTANQLWYWVKVGLLPEPEITHPGRGHGMGSVVRWPVACLDRLHWIVKARKKKNISIQRASRLLVIKRIRPLKAGPLRDTLLYLIASIDDYRDGHRKYLRSPQYSDAEKRRRLLRGVKAQNEALPRRERAALAENVAAFMGVPARHGDDTITSLRWSLSLDTLRNAVRDMGDDTLLKVFDFANEQFDHFVDPIFHVMQALSASSGIGPDKRVDEVTVDETSDFYQWMDIGEQITFAESLWMIMLLTGVAAQSPEIQALDAQNAFAEGNLSEIFTMLGFSAEVWRHFTIVDGSEGGSVDAASLTRDESGAAHD
jgi:hypothetical protein